jgi:hypothetical protein
MSDNNTNDIMERMWVDLQSFQPFADSEGHGESWRTMCEQRTAEAAQTAALEARQVDAPLLTRTAAWNAAEALRCQQHKQKAARVAERAQLSCDDINLAKEKHMSKSKDNDIKVTEEITELANFLRAFADANDGGEFEAEQCEKLRKAADALLVLDAAVTTLTKENAEQHGIHPWCDNSRLHEEEEKSDSDPLTGIQYGDLT